MRFLLLMLLSLSPMLAAASAADAERATMLQERREKLKQKWEAQFRAADRDESRGLTREEIREAGLPGSLIDRFEEIDVDRDGALNPEELWAVYEQRLAAQQRVPGPPK